jgi:Na+-transporting NADH:ubiquinone oxidoreductase subunit NqrC
LQERRSEAWEALQGERRAGWFFVDRVIGKEQLITYALALDADGTVRGIEILDYRETRGGEIRNADWRRQFVGKKPGDELRAGADIRNISGATLSCRHVTNGVKRLLALYAEKLK